MQATEPGSLTGCTGTRPRPAPHDDAGVRRLLQDELDRLLRTVRVAKQRWEEHVPGLTATHRGLLDLLARTAADDGCRLKDLAAALGVDASTASREVAALIDRGLVERRRDELDGRAARLVLSSAGRDLLAQAQESVDEVLAGVLQVWTPDEVLALVAGLHRFTVDLAARVGDPRGRSLTSTLQSRGRTA